MKRIFLSGCNGRMGRAVSTLCAASLEICVTAGLDVVTEKKFDYPVYADPMEFGGRADVLVDFSHTSVLPSLLSYGLRKQCPLVLCTTGYDQAQRNEISKASEAIPIFQSGNMSLGIHLLADLVKRAAKVLGEDFNIEIVEKHHNQKLDAPSGTAMVLFDAARDALPIEPQPVYDRHAVRQKRSAHEIGLHAVRGGTIVGEHEVIFAGHDEVLTLSHSAGSREVFAAGAVRAALFMAGVQKPGLYGMGDVLGS